MDHKCPFDPHKTNQNLFTVNVEVGWREGKERERERWKKEEEKEQQEEEKQKRSQREELDKITEIYMRYTLLPTCNAHRKGR